MNRFFFRSVLSKFFFNYTNVNVIMSTPNINVTNFSTVRKKCLDTQLVRSIYTNPYVLCSECSADSLTTQEKTAYSKLFNEMDQDKDGVISKEELKKGLLDFIGYAATELEINESMDVLDKNKDGKVDLKDFLDHMQTRKAETRLEAIRFTFDMWDSNSDGFIDSSDIKNMLKAVGEDPTDEKVIKIMQAADQDQDEKLSFNEFKEIFKNKHF